MNYKRGINHDNTPSVYGRDSVDWAYKTGILQEDDRHNVHLMKPCTRQEAVLYLKKLYELLSKEN